VPAPRCPLRVEGGALAYDAPKGVMTSELAAALKADKPAILAALAHPDLPGVSPDLAARLSAEDLEDIAAGDIPMGTVQAFEAAAVAREVEDLREAFEERAGILEFDAGMLRPEAELEAARITATLARNRGYLWASLRSALSGYPVLLAQVPDRAGTVHSLPFGTVHVREDAKPGPVSGSIAITESEIEAARKGRTVVRQGAGSQGVKA
jgi:TubC N-terminal docking domain